MTSIGNEAFYQSSVPLPDVRVNPNRKLGDLTSIGDVAFHGNGCRCTERYTNNRKHCEDTDNREVSGVITPAVRAHVHRETVRNTDTK